MAPHRIGYFKDSLLVNFENKTGFSSDLVQIKHVIDANKNIFSSLFTKIEHSYNLKHKTSQ